MKHQRLLSTLAVLLMLSFAGYGQAIKLKIANTEFKNMRYMDAIPYYEQLLENDPSNLEVKIKLAECYRKIRDNKNALRISAMLATGENPSSKDLWHYAQALASNGFYSEAAEWYQKYETIVPDDEYGRNYIKAYKNMDVFFKDSADYYVQFASSINSWAADFSPNYYKNGITFISNRDQHEVVRRVFEVDQSSFLTFFFASDTSTIQEDLLKPASRYTVDKSKDKHSDHTLGTSNDSNTPAHYGNTYLFDSVRHHDTNATQVVHISDDLQTKYHEGPATSTITQDTVLFTRSTAYFKTSGQKAESRFAMFMAWNTNGKWSEGKEVSVNGKDFSSGHPAYTPDNKKVYFASDRPGGKGGVDIYVVDYNHGVFGEPSNVEAVNTANNEMFPYVAPNGDLYFSSDGRPGLGGLDIFCAKIDGDQVTSIKNAGYPFNSGNDDFGIIWNKSMTHGFLSSNRKRGLTDDDIYAFKKLCRNVVAMVYDSITHEPLDSAYVQTEAFSGYTDHKGRLEICVKPGEYTFTVGKSKYESRGLMSSKSLVEIPMRPLMFDVAGKITSKQDDSPIEGVRVILTDVDYHTSKEIVTGKDGKYTFPLGISNNYTVTVAKNSCGTTSISRSTAGLTKSQTLTGNMEMLCKGDIIRIENIYYDLNKYTIRPDAAAELDKLVVLVNQYPDMRIELRSHTDSRASGPFNMKLSTNRAQAVLDYMATQGVLPSRMRASGYGETIPINKCTDGVKCTEDEYQMNRRTEFRVLSIN